MNPEMERRLQSQARGVEHLLQPPPVEQIRRLGDRRRRRRRTALGVAAAAAVLAGGAGVVSLGQPGDFAPPPVAVPSSATPTPDRATPSPFVPTPAPPDSTSAPANPITRSDLLGPSDAPWPEVELEEVVTAVGTGRSPDLQSVCFPEDGVARLEAPVALSRGFRYGGEPAGRLFSATVLQFGSADAAREAYARIRDWPVGCAEVLRDRGLEPVDAAGDGRRVEDETGRIVGEVSRVTYRPIGGADRTAAEGVGVGRVRDRVVVLMTRSAEGDAATERRAQMVLLRAAVERLR